MLSPRLLLSLAGLDLRILVCLHRISALDSHIADLLALLHTGINLHLLELLLALDVLTQLVADRLHSGALAHVHAQLGVLYLVATLL